MKHYMVWNYKASIIMDVLISFINASKGHNTFVYEVGVIQNMHPDSVETYQYFNHKVHFKHFVVELYLKYHNYRINRLMFLFLR